MSDPITDTLLELTPTSARGSMRAGALATIIVLGSAICMSSTSSSADTAVLKERDRTWRATSTTGGTPSQLVAADVATAQPSSGMEAINETRKLSGLTWDQMSRLFGVARRSLHFWASGKPLTPANEEKLHRVLAAIRQIDRGSAADNRQALLQAGRGGVNAFDLLADGRYGEAVELVGRGAGRGAVKPPAISEAARAARRPPPLADRVDTLHDRVHKDVGRTRRVRATRRQK